MIRYLLFDLDDTLYPASAGLMREISRRMNEFMVTQLGIPEGDVTRVRQDYWERYGTTLRGLYIERQIDAQAFLNFVHDIRTDEYLKADAVLDAMLEQLPQRKYIFTNSPADHAKRRVRKVERYRKIVEALRHVPRETRRRVLYLDDALDLRAGGHAVPHGRPDAQAPDPLIGTWNLDVFKSVYSTSVPPVMPLTATA